MFSELIGKTIIQVEEFTGGYEDRVIFKLLGGEEYFMHHDQDCCESVTLESVDQPWDTIYGNPVEMAEERSEQKDTGDGSETWTFYTIRTVKGTVNIRWYGSSNGYYSETVYFEKIKEADKLLTQ